MTFKEKWSRTLQSLSSVNEVEHVHIFNERHDSKVMGSIPVTGNKDNLRFLSVFYTKGVHGIKLNVN